ncbi:MAG: methyltransferase [Methanomicrobiaceae archaeon]|nr:methyltransferase [Methanomicrobiaceae archaeon]
MERGPFAVSRHPMYLGMAAILLDAAVLSGKAFAFLFPVAFIILMDRIFIPMEEEICEGIFQPRLPEEGPPVDLGEDIRARGAEVRTMARSDQTSERCQG